MKQGVPMVALRVMTAKEFEHFAEHSIREYAKDIERSQNLDAATAIARSRESFNHSLGDGLATANHSFFCIEAGQSDNCQTVGYFWIYLDGRKNSVFVYVSIQERIVE